MADQQRFIPSREGGLHAAYQLLPDSGLADPATAKPRSKKRNQSQHQGLDAEARRGECCGVPCVNRSQMSTRPFPTCSRMSSSQTTLRLARQEQPRPDRTRRRDIEEPSPSTLPMCLICRIPRLKCRARASRPCIIILHPVCQDQETALRGSCHPLRTCRRFHCTHPRHPRRATADRQGPGRAHHIIAPISHKWP